MTIHEKIKSEIPVAMKAKNAAALRTYRSLATAMTNEVVAKKRKPDELLTDEEALVVLRRAVNQRKDSIEQFTNAGRIELAEPEQEELGIISALLPDQLSEEEIDAIVKAKIEELGISDKSMLGKLMGAVMKDIAGRAEGGAVKSSIDKHL